MLGSCHPYLNPDIESRSDFKVSKASLPMSWNIYAINEYCTVVVTWKFTIREPFTLSVVNCPHCSPCGSNALWLGSVAISREGLTLLGGVGSEGVGVTMKLVLDGFCHAEWGRNLNDVDLRLWVFSCDSLSLLGGVCGRDPQVELLVNLDHAISEPSIKVAMEQPEGKGTGTRRGSESSWTWSGGASMWLASSSAWALQVEHCSWQHSKCT